ncbi:MAG: DUF483 domain-containing protein [Candidatus Aenigmarchaeota archaeon]|nr:DUF483 domain-containing protein [Candidatus Aenigmarchaeota archaeon]
MDLKYLKMCNIDVQSYLLLKAGLKSVIRTCLPEDSVKKFQNILEKLGVKVLIKRVDLLYGEPPKNPLYNVYISLSKKLAKSAYETEISGNRLAFGKLLGYPKCCVENFIENIKEGSSLKGNPDFMIRSYKKTKTKPSFYCNSLFLFDSKLSNVELKIYLKNLSIFSKTEHLFLIKHIPCSFDCKKSIKIGRVTLKLLKEHEPSLAKEIVNAVKRQVLYFDYFRWIVCEGKINGNEMSYKKVFPYKSLLDGKFMKKLKQGNRIEIKKDKTVIMSDNKKIFELPKEGILLDFT